MSDKGFKEVARPGPTWGQALWDMAMVPVAVPQALWVGTRAERLPEAAGPRQGVVGSGPDLRLLILGDSSAAGVGVDHQNDALSGQLVQRLSPRFRCHWQLLARSGATSADALADLRTFPGRGFDAAVIGLGVNDVKNGVRQGRWARQMSELVTLLRDHHGVAYVYLSAVPPVGDFPLLPHPLRGLLGRRAARFDAELIALAAARAHVRHVPFDVPITPDDMARDGFHPGTRIYRIWADRVARAIAADWPAA